MAGTAREATDVRPATRASRHRRLSHPELARRGIAGADPTAGGGRGSGG